MKSRSLLLRSAVIAGAAVMGAFSAGTSYGDIIPLSASVVAPINTTATVSLPAIGTFQVCAGVATTQVGKCDSTPLIVAGTLKVTLTGNVNANAAITVDTSPAACGLVPGVQLNVSGASAGATLTATVSGTGLLNQPVPPTTVSQAVGTPPAFARVCLAP